MTSPIGSSPSTTTTTAGAPAGDAEATGFGDLLSELLSCLIGEVTAGAPTAEAPTGTAFAGAEAEREGEEPSADVVALPLTTALQASIGTGAAPQLLAATAPRIAGETPVTSIAIDGAGASHAPATAANASSAAAIAAPASSTTAAAPSAASTEGAETPAQTTTASTAAPIPVDVPAARDARPADVTPPKAELAPNVAVDADDVTTPPHADVQQTPTTLATGGRDVDARAAEAAQTHASPNAALGSPSANRPARTARSAREAIAPITDRPAALSTPRTGEPPRELAAVAIAATSEGTEEIAPIRLDGAVDITTTSTESSAAAEADAPAEAPRLHDLSAQIAEELVGSLATMRREPGGVHRLTVSLKPVELGEVVVDVRFDADGMSLSLDAEIPATRELLQQGSATLRDELANLGLGTVEVDVGDLAQRSHQRSLDAEGRTRDERSDAAWRATEARDGEESAPTVVRAAPARRSTEGAVDVHV